MLKHNSLDEYWKDDLYLFIFNIEIHNIISIKKPDINTNNFGASILLLLIKINHKRRKQFKHQYN